MIKLSPGAKKLLVTVTALFVLFLVITQPQTAAGMIKDILSLLENGAESVVTFIQSLFA